MSNNELISGYDKVNRQMLRFTSEAMKGDADEVIQDSLDAITQLYAKVQKSGRTNTKIHLKDSEAFEHVSNLAAINAKNMKFDDAGLQLNQQEFVKKIKLFMLEVKEEEMDGDELTNIEASDINNGLVTNEDLFNQHNWLKMGILYQLMSRKSVRLDFLNGPLATEKKAMKARTRRIDDTNGNATATTARNVQASEIANNAEQNTAVMVQQVYRIFEKKDQGQFAGVNFFKFFINPKSFSQSIENLFFTSFLIKDAKLKLYIEDGIPMVQMISVQEMQHHRGTKGGSNSVHQIASLDYSTWQNLITTFNITESFLGHRGGTEDAFPEEDMELGKEELESSETELEMNNSE